MLEKLITEQQTELEALLYRNSEIEKRIKELEKEEEPINEEIVQLQSETREVSMTIYKKRNFLQNLLYRFSSARQEDMNAEVALRAKQQELIEREAEIRTEKGELQREQNNINVKNINSELQLLQDRRYAIKRLLEHNPTLRENPELMSELIREEPRYIAYDKSDNPVLYAEFMQIAVDSVKNNSEQNTMNDGIAEEGEAIISEIENPREAPEGKYKIPQKYLFEAIRSINFIKPEAREGEMQERIINRADACLRYDCELPLEYGQKMEELYTDKDNYLLTHVLGYSNPLSIEEKETIRDDIYVNGLRNSTQNGFNQLSSTTLGNYDGTYDDQSAAFYQLLIPSSKMLITIPKKAMDENSSLPVWGCDAPTPTNDTTGYVLPVYIYGYVNPTNISVEQNPVELKDRKQYKYKFEDSSTRPIKEMEEER